ncbi:MAG: hypothetical protein M3268_00195 [Acidobacteriota bacterium]|nr:hypothetical protein [Acidobacteriota bacterium]
MADFKKISDRLTSAFVSSGMDESVAKEVAFHLADWSDDAEGLVDTWHNLDQVDDERLLNSIYRFLAHVPNHVAAAKKLVGMGPIEDVFNVGVVVEDEDD